MPQFPYLWKDRMSCLWKVLRTVPGTVNAVYFGLVFRSPVHIMYKFAFWGRSLIRCFVLFNWSTAPVHEKMIGSFETVKSLFFTPDLNVDPFVARKSELLRDFLKSLCLLIGILLIYLKW